MKNTEFKKVFALADSDVDLSNENIDHFEGCGLIHFTKIAATLPQCAKMLRWQAMYIASNGSKWDMEQVQEMRNIFRQKVDLL